MFPRALTFRTSTRRGDTRPCLTYLADTPHGPRPGGFSGDACPNGLR